MAKTMGTMPPEKLVIFDYSGTLSPDAPRFARTENLVRILRETGLAAFGVSTAEFFWNEIVNPTWVEGSTTTAGYSKVMADRIHSLGLVPEASRPEIAATADRFVQSYLRHSRIDPHWQPALLRLNDHPSTLTIVATDHYKEATKAIIGNFESLGIAALQADESTKPARLPAAGDNHAAKCTRPSFCVANSADLGFWKDDRRFWTILASGLPMEKVRRILLIDDFGSNEAEGDNYRDRTKVLARKEKTLAVLCETFRIKAEVFPFVREDCPRERAEVSAHLIAEASARIGEFLGVDHGR